jgi:hypothetical protein
VADALRKEPGTSVQVIDGDRGEFTVTVDGREVARKGESLPPVEEVLAAVRKAEPATAGAKR